VIARLAGLVAEKADDHAVVDVNGVGYRVQLSAVSLAALPAPGERVALRTYTYVREDALQLFGFATEEEETVFHELISVKNVGPRAAQNILSGIEARELARAVADGDVARLTKVPGVGKKTAERLVVELKEKLVSLARAAAPRAAAGAGPFDQVEQALIGLGFKPAQATGAVDALRERTSAGGAATKGVDELLREALKLLRQ
jgi:Holliday junction DNA helicase RuvA